MASPLAKRLFSLDGVSGVFYGADYVTVTKKDDFTWPMLKPDIFAAIMDHFSSGVSGGLPSSWCRLAPGSSALLAAGMLVLSGMICGSCWAVHRWRLKF